MGETLRAERSFNYGGKALKTGDTFTTRSRADAITLTATGRATRIFRPSEPAARHVAAESPTSSTNTKPRRRYNRRDMVADE